MNVVGMGFFSGCAASLRLLLHYAFSLPEFTPFQQAQKKNPVNIGFYANEF
jgi:hypothetical protein